MRLPVLRQCLLEVAVVRDMIATRPHRSIGADERNAAVVVHPSVQRADFSDRILAANRSAMIALVPRVVAQPGALESRLTNDGAE